MKNVIELIRVSTEAQAGSDRASIPAQKTVNARTAYTYGLKIVRTIQMADVSGAAVLQSPEMMQLMRLMADPEIHGVVAREFSRLMRPENFGDYALLQVFVDSKTILYLPEGPMDLSSKTGRLMGTIRAAMAGLERTEILERIWSAKEEKRRRGELGQSKNVLPFGVDYQNKQWSYKPEAERVREAFRRFLAGDTNYKTLAEMVGVTPRGMHVIMRNPIWKGWRIIDKKRDMAASAKRTKTGGRQGDRPKIARQPDEVIRVKVIEEPLLSEAEFDRVQLMMNTKQRRHWRTQPDTVRRFTYNGFLNCSECGALIYTAYRRDDYYVCKNKRVGSGCQSRSMRRDRLEKDLDSLFSKHLTDETFLEAISKRYEESANSKDEMHKHSRLQNQRNKLSARRERVLDGYFEGVIARADRDKRIGSIDAEIASVERLMMEVDPTPTLTSASLAEAFVPFYEWDFLQRDEKRKLLQTVVPSIHVADYVVSGISVFGGNENTRTDKGSWQQPA
jgi:DNA invertase Pin-like site-specific DNA recombinase